MSFQSCRIFVLGLLLTGMVGCPSGTGGDDAGESKRDATSGDTGDVAPEDVHGETRGDAVGDVPSADADVEDVTDDTSSESDAGEEDAGTGCEGEGCFEVSGVATVAEGGNWVDLAIDGEGVPHLVYNTVAPEQGVQYATRADGTWSTTLIDDEGDVGEGASIAVGSDTVHVAFNDETDGEVRYGSSSDGSSWNLESVASVGEDGYQTSLALDAEGRPHVAFLDAADEAMFHAVREEGSWSTEEIGSATPGFARATNSLVIDAEGTLHLTYDDSGPDELKYARRDSGTWSVETVASLGGDLSLGTYNSIEVVDGRGPIVSFGDEVAGSLKVAARDEGSWETQVVDDEGEVGLHTSLGVTSDETRLISYYDSTNDNLKFASVTDSDVRVQTLVTEGNAGFSTRLAIDGEGTMHLAYVQQSPWRVKYATVE